MFDEETVNAFNGGYRVSESGVATLFGMPTVSDLKKVIAFPLSLSVDSLVRANETVVWRGVNSVELPMEMSKLTNDWFDPIKLMTNIAIQRGWKKAPYILANERLGYQLALGYYSAFIDTLIQSFSLVNGVTLSSSEFLQISSEIQDKIVGHHFSYEAIARQHGKENSLLFYDEISSTYKNEIVTFEPFSLFLISENYLGTNQNFISFTKNFNKFKEGKMMAREPSSLKFPYLGIQNHLRMEEEAYTNGVAAFENNDVQRFIGDISRYSQSLGYNLGVLSDFQKAIATLLEKYGIKNYAFNVCEYSGSVIVFADSLEISKVKDNAIRDYYNATNRTIRFDELEVSRGSWREPIRT